MKQYLLLVVFFGAGCLDGIFSSTMHHGMNSFVGMPMGPLPYRLKGLHPRSAMFGDMYPQMMPYLPPMTFASGKTDISFQPETPPQAEPEKPCYANDCDKTYEDTTQYVKTDIENSSPIYEEIATTKTPNYEESTTQKAKVFTKKPKPIEESSEEDDANWNGRGYPSGPGMNIFFPMTFGYPYSHFGGNNARSHGNGNGNNDVQHPPSNSGNNGYPGGSVTAIANSFSSGKGGVATSHATAFGNAPPVNFYSNSKKRSHDN